MRKYRGRTIFEGYAIEDVVVYRNTNSAPKRAFTSADIEFERFKGAREKAIEYFDTLFESTLKKLGEKEATLFKTHRLMVEDYDFEDLVKANIAEEKIAEDAVYKAGEQMSAMFAAMTDEYMKARAADALEVGNVLRNILLGRHEAFSLNKPCILICEDLPASLLMKFERRHLKGLVLTKGSVTSHVAIFARTLELPTVCAINNLEVTNRLNGHKAIVDANTGEVIISPTVPAIKEYRNLAKAYAAELASLHDFVGKPSVTKDGKKVKIYANIASAFEVENVNKNDAEGIGLFRSEFLYLSSRNYPTEDFQFNYYREVIEDMHGKEVIIRTMDVGADKKVDYFGLPEEENPALGYRSIRICRDRPEVFKTQIRALYRASAYGNIAIMIPMIISLEEVLYVKRIVNEVKRELTKSKIKFNDKVKVGIMIETPAAAVLSDVLAKHVDFFSIGTNDLSQYTLACDRLNPMLSETFNPHHPSILRLIKLTIDNAHKAGITCGMCGELARDSYMLPFLLACGIDELSCSSAYVLRVRKSLSELDTKTVDIEQYLLPHKNNKNI